MKNAMLFLMLVVFTICQGCKSVGDKTREAINKTGQVVGEGSSEFVKGVTKGVETALECELVVSDALKQKGVSFGRYYVSKDSDGGNKNKLTVYLIFNAAFGGSISAKVFDQKGVEYGRANNAVTAKQGEAQYVDFIFDKRTDVESKSKFVLE